MLDRKNFGCKGNMRRRISTGHTGTVNQKVRVLIMKCSGKAVSVTVRRSKDGTKNYVDLTVAEDFRSPVQVVGVEAEAQDDALDLQEGDDVEALIEQRSFEGKIRLVAVSIKSKKLGVSAAKAA